MGEWFLGMEMADDPFLPQSRQMFFALYTVAAAIYRWIVAFSICWFLYKLFESYELKIIGQIVVLASLYGLFCQPLYQLGKFFYVPGRLDKVKKSHFYPSLIGVLAILGAFLFVPLPHSVLAPLEIQARDAENVFVVYGGSIESIDVRPGQKVIKGQKLAQLRNHDLDLKIAELQGKADLFRQQLVDLQRQASEDRRAMVEISSVKETLASTEEQLRLRQGDRDRLRLTAPIDGVVLPPNYTPKREDPDLQLGEWYGTPLDRENKGAYLKEMTLFCQIGDPKKLEAVLVIDQGDRNMVDRDKKADLKIEGLPWKTYRGLKIEGISEKELDEAPKRLAAKYGGELPTKTDQQTGRELPQSTCYQANIPIDDDEGLMLLGLRGTARIYTRPLSGGERLLRFLSQTFYFKL
jgi:putative peptide zinc metalloprotease protein